MTRPQGLLGKAYLRTLAVILTVLGIGFAGLVCWYEVTTPPQERMRPQ